MAYPCDSDDGNAAVMLITNLENGDTFACCGECFPTWVRTVADQLAPAPAVIDAPLPDDSQAPPPEAAPPVAAGEGGTGKRGGSRARKRPADAP